jgi:hypothetical protein
MTSWAYGYGPSVTVPSAASPDHGVIDASEYHVRYHAQPARQRRPAPPVRV